MTLVAAWITPEFRIVSSDSRLTDKDGTPINENIKKIYANDQMAIALFGGFSSRLNVFIKQELQTKKFEYENWRLSNFTEIISNYLSGDVLPNENETIESNILIIPESDEPLILRIVKNQIEQHSLKDYKNCNHITELNDLFFSEQIKNNKIDFDHQKELLKHFTAINEEFINEKSKFRKYIWPIEVKILMSLINDCKIEENSKINRNNIGGHKIYCTFSFKGENWQQIMYPEDEFFSWKESMQSIIEKLNTNTAVSQKPSNLES